MALALGVPVALLTMMATKNFLWVLCYVLLTPFLTAAMRFVSVREPQLLEVIPRYLKYDRYFPARGSIGTPYPAPLVRMK